MIESLALLAVIVREIIHNRSELSTLNTHNRRRLFAALSSAAAVLFLIGSWVGIAAGDDPTPPDDSAECASADPYYYSYDADGNRFGPPVSEELQAAVAELHTRRCADPALVVAHAMYHGKKYLDLPTQQAEVTRLVSDRVSWRYAVDMMTIFETNECAASIETMSDDYQTLYMLDGADRSVAPGIHKASPDVPSFRVLRYTCSDGRVFNYKLDCGFQPVDQDFPDIPEIPDNPTPTTGPPPSVTQPPTTGTPTTGPPTTRPPTTTTPPTTECPTGPEGCKDGDDDIVNNPPTCNLPDDLCHGGTGPTIPRPPETSQPRPTVAPPPVTPPPTVAPPPTQPTVTSTIVTPPTAPA